MAQNKIVYDDVADTPMLRSFPAVEPPKAEGSLHQHITPYFLSTGLLKIGLKSLFLIEIFEG